MCSLLSGVPQELTRIELLPCKYAVPPEAAASVREKLAADVMVKAPMRGRRNRCWLSAGRCLSRRGRRS